MPVEIARPVCGHLIRTVPTLTSCSSLPSFAVQCQVTVCWSQRLPQWPELAPTACGLPGFWCGAGSACSLQHPGDALLEGLGCLGRSLLRKLPELPALRGRGIKILARLGDREIHDLRRRLR